MSIALMNTAIRLQKVSKVYRLGQSGGRASYRTLAEDVGNVLRRLRSGARLWGREKAGVERISGRHLWALREVSLEIERGESVGIIGPNGAGKSTLIKLIAGITEATSGKIGVRGCVAVLLEVNAGIHPELTGRENIYLNGTIMGLRKAEIDRKFDRIVAFGGLKDFLDTPVKRYSSGMRARLGMSVAVHMEPDIMLIDEVLAVGDLSFQARCLKKMLAFRDSGVTVLLVSHQMKSILTMARRVIWLEEGRIVKQGDPLEVVRDYERHQTLVFQSVSEQQDDADPVFMESVDICGADGRARLVFEPCETVTLRMRYQARQALPKAAFGFSIRNEQNVICGSSQLLDGCAGPVRRGMGAVQCRFQLPPLHPGKYYVQCGCQSSARVKAATSRVLGEFQIRDGITHCLDEDGRSFFEAFRTYSPLALEAEWSRVRPGRRAPAQ